jgi:bifunctional NMN adenylyltransferase/nudix hydrolase
MKSTKERESFEMINKYMPVDRSVEKEILRKRAASNSSRALSASKTYDLLVFIGRFQPYHLGHKKVIDKALKMADNVLVIIGSANRARSTRNPFTFGERAVMISNSHPDNGGSLFCRPMNDFTYNDTKWVTEVQSIVNKEALRIANGGGFHNHGTADIKVGLIGCEKDHTSYYLKLFPQWANEGVEFVSPLNATAIRQIYFETDFNRWEMDAIMPDYVVKTLLQFKVTAEYDRLKAEYEYLKNYRKQWGEGPFMTGDSLVQVSGNILLIKRGKEYGHGLWALPGGFLHPYEKFYDGAIRELREETRLKVPAPVLRGSLVSSEVFDDPHRSERGRIVTVCHHFKLVNELSLPEVRGSDDAEWAGFVDFSTLDEKDFFEDHYHIIRKMLEV